MPNEPSRIEIITGRERRRRYSAKEKLQLVDDTMQPGMTVSPSPGYTASLQACCSSGGN